MGRKLGRGHPAYVPTQGRHRHRVSDEHATSDEACFAATKQSTQHAHPMATSTNGARARAPHLVATTRATTTAPVIDLDLDLDRGDLDLDHGRDRDTLTRPIPQLARLAIVATSRAATSERRVIVPRRTSREKVVVGACHARSFLATTRPRCVVVADCHAASRILTPFAGHAHALLASWCDGGCDPPRGGSGWIIRRPSRCARRGS